jgi:glycerol-3-phosphate acyltransferase PlsY
MRAALTFLALAIPAALLFLLLRRRLHGIWQSPISWRIINLAGIAVFAVLGLIYPLAFLGPPGVPAALAGATLGAEIGVALTLYNLWVQRLYYRLAVRIMDRNPSLREKPFFREILNRFRPW